MVWHLKPLTKRVQDDFYCKTFVRPDNSKSSFEHAALVIRQMNEKKRQTIPTILVIFEYRSEKNKNRMKKINCSYCVLKYLTTKTNVYASKQFYSIPFPIKTYSHRKSYEESSHKAP